MRISRRGLLVLGVASGTVAGCSKSSSSPTNGRSGSPLPVTPSSPASSAPRPVRPADWSRLQRHVEGNLLRPGSPAYDQVRLVENPRFDSARPLGVLTVADGQDVATAIRFAQDHAVPIAIRSGGHSYTGISAGGAAHTGVSRSLVLDCRSLDQVTIDGTTATIGAGAALAPVYSMLAARGRAIPGGSCATVGVGGLTLGGGVGVLTRAMGLTCDSVTAMQVVTADGRIRTADADQNPDLYWALRGGGGGRYGVVTSFRFDTRAAPTVHTFLLRWSFADAALVIPVWQAWAPTADHRLWSTLKLLGGATHPSGPTLLLSGTWTGPGSSLATQLAGLLDHCPAPSVRSTDTKSYGQAMAGYAGCSDLPVSRCNTGPGGGLERESFGATSHVGYRALDRAGVDDLLGQVERAQSSGLKEAGISMDALGGKVADVDPGDTAFVHRKALMTVQYTGTFTGDRAAAADSYVHGFRHTMAAHWGRHAYVNYADATIEEPGPAYFGANAARLAQLRQSLDPHSFFGGPRRY